jgi:hypothetical protein
MSKKNRSEGTQGPSGKTAKKPCPSPNCRGGMRTNGEVCAKCYGRGEVTE